MRLDLCGIKKHFGPVRANDGVDLTVQPGAIHGLLGENGAGKTTLMKILTGYLSADAGEVRIDGVPVQIESPADSIRLGIGMLHQDPLDVPPLKIVDDFLLGFDQRLLLRRRWARGRLRELAERFSFSLDPDARVHTLSVGERQQLEILRLLALGADVIILDEPTTGISALQKVLLFSTLRRLAEEEGKTIIFVSHKLEEVEELCDRVTVLRHGKVMGHLEAPVDAEQLVKLMFGQILVKPRRRGVELGEPVLQIERGAIDTYRLSVPNIELDLRAGEVVGLAGLAGSGQRLMLHACVGLHWLSSGALRLGGRDFTRRSYRDFLAAGVAYLPAGRIEEGLIGGLTLTEHYVLSHRGKQTPLIDWEAAGAQMGQRVRDFRILGSPDSRIETLSGGNQQRTMLALMPSNLKLLALEHPTRGLDIESAMWVWERLLERRAGGTAILFISSDLDELLENSDRMLVFSGGVITGPLDAASLTVEQLGYLIGGMRDLNGMRHGRSV
jgi:ABC-type uncharacterized transport system ATPase subunit